MKAVGIRDFSIRDINQPDPKRFPRCLSALINFTKFREERAQQFNELHEGSVSHKLCHSMN